MSSFIHTDADLQTAMAALVAQDPRLVPVLEKAGMPALRRREAGFAYALGRRHQGARGGGDVVHQHRGAAGSLRQVERTDGDIGIALGPVCGGVATVALFPGPDGVPRLIPRVRLPAHQPAFGLTIHKSQGSEWDRVALELPANADSRLLNRNLLYTGITRSRRVLDLFGTAESLALVLNT